MNTYHTLSWPAWADQRQEIVFIGADPLNEAAFRSELDACLVESTKYVPERWHDMLDPFPAWQSWR